MVNLRMMVGIEIEEESELSALLKNGTGVSDDEVQRPERGLHIMSREKMTRRLQSHGARNRNMVDHVSILYRNR